MLAHSPVYHPREPTDSPLWKILHNHYEDFNAGYGEHCEKQYGFFRPVVDEVVEEYLRCGDLHEGFARVRCTNPECKHEYLLALPTPSYCRVFERSDTQASHHPRVSSALFE